MKHGGIVILLEIVLVLCCFLFFSFTQWGPATQHPNKHMESYAQP